MDINQRMYHLLDWPDQPKKQDKAEEPAKDKQQEENK